MRRREGPVLRTDRNYWLVRDFRLGESDRSRELLICAVNFPTGGIRLPLVVPVGKFENLSHWFFRATASKYKAAYAVKVEN